MDDHKEWAERQVAHYNARTDAALRDYMFQGGDLTPPGMDKFLQSLIDRTFNFSTDLGD